MKKSLLLTALTAFGLSSYAQTFVSTTPENRNVVLEEFTGISCPNCPDGHRRASEFRDDNPGDVILVNIHVGGYATPNGPGTDFRTAFGTALVNQSGLCGYPAGTVNREEFPGYEQTDNQGNSCGATTAQSRGAWSTTGAQVLGESSPVNVAGQATLDLSTGKLTVVVEAYYTGNASNPTNKLTVAVLQNNIAGPQSGANANPSQVIPEGYNHNHMLRHFLTGQWGASVSPTTMGSFFTDSYVWDVPTDINGTAIDLNNLEVVVYIAEGNEDIISGSEVELSLVSPNAYDALPAEIEVPEFICDSEVAPKVTIQNMGNEDMTSLTIKYNVNGGAIQTYNWTGSLVTGATEEVTLPSVAFNHLSTNTLWVSTQGPNGQADAVSSNNNATKTFQPSKNSGTSVTVTINTDNYGSETSWSLKDPSGSVVASGGPYTNVSGGETFTETVTLANGCHSFEIVDGFGDGMCCQYGQGNYKIESNGVTLYQNGEFSTSEERSFKVGGSLGINDLELVNNVKVYPNPFNDNAKINYNLVETGVVTLEMFNTLGAKVLAENLGEKGAGAHSATISAEGLDAGVYMVNLNVNGSIFSTRISIAK